jgi:hypothetical protein
MASMKKRLVAAVAAAGLSIGLGGCMGDYGYGGVGYASDYYGGYGNGYGYSITPAPASTSSIVAAVAAGGTMASAATGKDDAGNGRAVAVVGKASARIGVVKPALGAPAPTGLIAPIAGRAMAIAVAGETTV